MRQSRGRVGRRGRVALALLVVVLGMAGAIVVARKPLAHWAVARALAGAGIGPASFRVDGVGLSGIGIAGVSIGSPAWLTADRVDTTFTLAGLLGGRAGAVTISGVRWTVDARGERVDWGLEPPPGGASGPFDLPCDTIELRGATIRALMADAEHDLSLDGRVSRSGPGAATGAFEAGWQDVSVTIEGSLAADGTRTKIDARGDVTIGADSASWTAAGLQDSATATATLDAEITTSSLAQRVGDVSLSVINGRIGAHVTLGAGGATGSTLAVRAGEIRAGAIVLRAADAHATLVSPSAAEVRFGASGEGWELPAALASVGWKASVDEPGSYVVSADARTDRPATFKAPSVGATGSVDDVRVTARALAGRSGVRLLDGRASAEGVSAQAGDAALSDGRAEAALTDGSTVRVTSLSGVLSDGAVLGVEPFAWEIGERRVAATLTATNLSLAHWLPVITNNRATGEGRVSGGVDLALDWSDGPVRLVRLDGSLRANPEHGFIQASDADALGDLLERQDPRFATDEVMRPVRDKIVGAMRDFEFHALTADLSRDGDRTTALTYLSGFGRHGEDPQGINLTLDLHVQDSFVGLASRLAAKARIRDATGAALEDFFGGPAGAKEDR